MKSFFVILFLLFAEGAFAVISPFPVGHLESFMANTGAALEDSPGNVIYNPAGLGFREAKELNISVSGNALGQQHFQLEGLEQQSNDLKLRPLLTAGIYPIADGMGAVFVANPISFKIFQGTQSESGAAQAKANVTVDTDNIAAGVSYARNLNSSFSWGVSTGVTFSSTETYAYSSYQTSSIAATEYQESHTKNSIIFLMPGIMWKITPDWTVGASMNFTPVTLNDEASRVDSVTNSATPTQISQTTVKYKTHSKEDPDVLLGTQVRLGLHRLFTDVAYNGVESAQNENGVNTTSSAFWSYSVGWKYDRAGQFQPMAGLGYADRVISTDYIATAGCSILNRANELILGLYYTKSDSRSSTDSSYDSVGVMFSSSLNY